MKRHRSGDDPKACAIKTSLLKDTKAEKKVATSVGA